MSGNRGSRFTRKHYPRRTFGSVLNGKSSIPEGGVKFASFGGGGMSRISSRNVSRCQRSVARPYVSYGKYAASFSQSESIHSSSSSSSASNTSLSLNNTRPLPFSHLGSSDESESDVDAKHVTGWRNLSATFSGPFDSFDSSSINGGALLSRHLKNEDGAPSSVIEKHESCEEHSGIALAHTNSTYTSCNSTNIPGSTSHKQQIKPLQSSSAQGRSRLNVECGSTCIASRFLGHLIYAGGDPSNNSAIKGSSYGMGNKRKHIVPTASKQRSIQPGAGCREVNNTRGLTTTSLLHKLGSGMHNIDCSSLADVSPYVSSSSMDVTCVQSHQKMAIATHVLRKGSDLQGNACVRKSHLESGNQSRPKADSKHLGRWPPTLKEHNVRSVDVASRNSRQSLCSFIPKVRCPRSAMHSETNTVTHYVSSLGLREMEQQHGRRRGCRSSMWSAMLSEANTMTDAVSSFGLTDVEQQHDCQRGTHPVVSRGRSVFTSLPISKESLTSLGNISRECWPQRFAGDSTKVVLGNDAQNNLFIGSSSVSIRSRPYPPSTSGSMTLRQPFVQSSSCGLLCDPPMQDLEQTRASSCDALSKLSQVNHNLSSSPSSVVALMEKERKNRLGNEPATIHGSHASHIQFLEENGNHCMMERLSEILSALEQIETDEVLSYEQILMLEATVLLDGLGLHDRHRDMRLDVDNMSYEELLSLEERIGNVSTGLSEDAVKKCVKRSLFVLPDGGDGYTPEEVKCSICQEEFEEGMELGVLDCGHCHHIACIKMWLMQKNWCPICKVSAFTELC